MSDNLLYVTGFILLVIGMACAFITIIRNNSDESYKKNLDRAVRDAKPIVILFAAVLGFTIMVTVAALNAGSDTGDLWDSFKLGFSSSLTEDILFFGVLGIGIFVLQRNDFFKSKRFEDRIDYLFNSKDLSSEERSDLKQKISEIATDFQMDRTTMTVEDISSDYKWIKLDVVRVFTVKNYLDDWNAEYNFGSEITPDNLPQSLIEQGEKALIVYPVSIERSFVDKSGQVRKVGEVDYLSAYESFPGTHGKIFHLKDQKRTIKPGQTMSCSLHFVAWHELVPANKSKKAIVDKISDNHVRIENAAPYSIHALRHWDSWAIDFINKLQEELSISVEIPSSSTNIKVGSGRRTEDAWTDEDITAGKKVLIRFTEFRQRDNAKNN